MKNMENKSIEISDDIKVEIPKYLFDEAGIPIDCVFEIYCVDGKIIITEQIGDDFICDKDCDSCPRYEKCEGDYDRQDEIHDFIKTLSPKEQELVQVQLDLKQINTKDDINDKSDNDDNLKSFTIQIALKWGEKMNGEQNER